MSEYDVFVSYAEPDRIWVQGYLLDALHQAGVRYHSEAAFALGGPRLLEFERAIQQSRRIVLVLSPAYLADGFTQFPNLLAQSYGLETATWPVIPLILRPVQLPPRLSMLTALDATDSADWPGVIERLCDALQRPVPGSAPKPLCPYPGMVPFGETDSQRFFGRDAEVQGLLECLRLHPFVTVIGPSGSGKSSLVFAGLIPALRQSSLFGPGEWLVRTLRPGEAPLAALSAALGGDPANAGQAVSELLATQPNTRRLLLVVDQFEEVFTVARADIMLFHQALLRLAETSHCYLVLIVRADFYPDLMATPLWRRIQAHRFEVLPLDEHGLREAIVRPAAAEDVGVFVEPALVERLVADAAAEPGILPLIQEALVLLWERLQRRLLPLSAYEALGSAGRTGLQVAMAHRADTALADLPSEQPAIARRILLRLVQFGEGRADTRRQQPVAELRSVGDEPHLFDQTLRHLVDGRLLTLSGEEGGEDRKVDISHEALIAGWPTLQKWLTEWREAEQIRRRLEDKADEWVRLGQTSGGLLDVVELLEAERWLASPDALDLGYDASLPALVGSSRKAQRRTARLRRGALGAIILLIITALSIGLASQRLLAQNAKAFAREQERFAREQQSLAEAESRARAEAEARRAEAERLRLVSIAQVLAAQAPHQQDQSRQDERGALLARQAYLFNQRSQGQVVGQVDDALRTVLSASYFSQILRGYEGTISYAARIPDVPGLRAVAFSPDGQRLGVGGYNQIIRLWELRQPGTTPTILQGHQGDVLALAFSPDGQTLASGSDDNTVRLWKLRQPSAAPTILGGCRSSVRSLVFSPNGQILASGGYDADSVCLWELRQPSATPVVLRGHQGGVLALAFSPDGQTLAAGSEDNTIHLWELRQPSATPVVLRGHQGGVLALAFSPDGQTLVSGGEDHTVRLWALHKPGAAPTILRSHEHWVLSVAFSPDGRTLASGSYDSTVRLWELRQPNTTPIVLRGHQGGVRLVAFSRDGQMLMSSSVDDTVRLWALRQPSAAPTILQGHQGDVSALAFSPDGQTLASGSDDNTVRLWQRRQPSAAPTILQGHQGRVLSVAFSPDGRVLASGGYDDNTVRLWELRQPSPVPTVLPVHNSGVMALAFILNGQTLASGSIDSTVHLWDVHHPDATSTVLRSYEGSVWSLAFSPDGQTLALGIFDSTIQLRAQRQVGAAPTVLRGHQGDVLALAFSPDGQTLASGGRDSTVRLWDLRQPNAAPTVLQGHQGDVLALAFSPDGQTLASGGRDSTVRLWDLRQPNAAPTVLQGHQGDVLALAFSPDGQTLASGSKDKTIRLWIARVELLADMVCEKVWRNLTLDEWRQFVGADISYQRTCSNLPSGEGVPPDAPVATR